MIRLRLFPVLLLVSIISLPLREMQAEISPRLMDEVLDRKVVVVPIEDHNGIPGIMMVMAVNASRNRIWQVLLDYENYPNVFDGIDRIKVHKRDHDGAVVEYWSSAASLINVNYTLYRHYDKPYYKMSWHRTAGSLKRIEGSWSILDAPSSHETKILVHHSFMEVGNLIPVGMLRFLALKKSKLLGHRLRKWIEKEKTKELPHGKITFHQTGKRNVSVP